MKRILCLLLALFLLLSLVGVAFAGSNDTAVKSVSTTPYVYNHDAEYTGTSDMTSLYHSKCIYAEDIVPYGETLYFPLETNEWTEGVDGGSTVPVDQWVNSFNAVSATNITASWKKGSEYVQSITLVKKKVSALNQLEISHSYGANSFYFVALEVGNASPNVVEVSGTITLSKTTGGTEWAFDEDVSFPVSVKIGAKDLDPCEIQIKNAATSFNLDTQDYITFAASPGSYFIVNTTRQSNVICRFDTEENPEIMAKYPSANLSFYTGNNLVFYSIGQLNLSGEKDQYLYEIKNDTLTPVSATYDSSKKVYRFSENIVGAYVLSDIPLV